MNESSPSRNIESITEKLTQKAAAQSSTSSDLDLLQAYKAIVKPEVPVAQTSRAGKAEKRDLGGESVPDASGGRKPAAKRARISQDDSDVISSPVAAKWTDYFVGRSAADLNTSSETIENQLDLTDDATVSVASELESTQNEINATIESDMKKRNASTSHEQEAMPQLVAITPEDKSRLVSNPLETSTELSPPDIDKEGVESKMAAQSPKTKGKVKVEDETAVTSTRKSARRAAMRRSVRTNESLMEEDPDEEEEAMTSSARKRHSARVRQPTEKASAMARARQEFEKTQEALSKKSRLAPTDEKLLRGDHSSSDPAMAESALTLKRDAEIKVRTTFQNTLCLANIIYF